MTSDLHKKQRFYEVIRSQAGDWIERVPVMTGSLTGELAAPGGKIWVRFGNGKEEAVINPLTPIGKDRHILVGRLRSQPRVWQVAEIRRVYQEDNLGNQYINFHHEQHEEDGPDRLSLSLKQIKDLSVRVADGPNFIVHVYGRQTRGVYGNMLIKDTFMDVSSYVPSAGAIFVNIETDPYGTLSIHEGVPFGSKESRAITDIPLPDLYYNRVASILLFEMQSILLDEHIIVPSYLESNPGNYQPFDDDLTAIAELTPTEGDILRYVSGAWVNVVPTDLFSALPQILTDDDCNILFDDPCEILYSD